VAAVISMSDSARTAQNDTQASAAHLVVTDAVRRTLAVLDAGSGEWHATYATPGRIGHVDCASHALNVVRSEIGRSKTRSALADHQT